MGADHYSAVFYRQLVTEKKRGGGATMDLENYYNAEDIRSELEITRSPQRGFTPMRHGKFFAWVKNDYVEDREKVGWVLIKRNDGPTD